MLQLEINGVSEELSDLLDQMESIEHKVTRYQKLLSGQDATSLFQACEIEVVNKRFENIAGVEIPIFEEIHFQKSDYALFDTPVWLESGIEGIQDLIITREKKEILKEKKKLLEKELREVSIRVNLFEKIMIPRTQTNIKKIKIFLGDQQLAAVSQAKVSKRKIEKRRKRA